MKESEGNQRDEAPGLDGPPMSFEEAREKLRLRGYLDRGVEGAVLKSALASRTRTRGVLRAAAVAAGFLAISLAAAETAAMASFSRLPPGDAAVLFLWVLLASALVSSFAVLLLMLAAWVRVRSRQDGESVSTEIGIGFGLLAGTLGAAAAFPALKRAGPLAATAVLLLVGVLVFLAVRVARSVTFTMLLASGRVLLRGRGKVGGLSSLFLALFAVGVALIAVFPARTPEEEPLIVEGRTTTVLLVAVDGWSDRFVRQKSGWREGRVLPYQKASRDPAAFWTTIATGETAVRHGVGAMDLVRVKGVSRLVHPGPASALYLQRLLPALGLSRRETATSTARQVPAAWEVAQRAGIASLTVNWWTTYPVAGPAGTVLSNHLYFAARDGESLEREGYPLKAVRAAARLVPKSPPPAGALERLLFDARQINRFAEEAFLDAIKRDQPRLAMVYLPGLDILLGALSDSARTPEERVVIASEVRDEADRVSQFLEGVRLLPGSLIAFVLDKGRDQTRGEIVFHGDAISTRPVPLMRPEDLLPTVMMALGVPPSRTASGKPRTELLDSKLAMEKSVETWGRVSAPSEMVLDSKSYIENLRSLGYLR